MASINKEEVFLEVTAELVRFYTFIAHAVKGATDAAAAEFMTLDQVTNQIRQSWTALSPRLEASPVVLKRVEVDYQKAVDLIKNAGGPGGLKDPAAREEALRLHSYAQAKVAAFSDLVAVFKRL